MPDVTSSPMLPLHWTESSASCANPAEGAPSDPAYGTRLSGGDLSHPAVVVRTSSRRRKTATAFWENGQIVVVLPSHVPKADRAGIVDRLVARVLAKRPRATTSDDALVARAELLADRYVEGIRPTSIRWVTNQGKRWASCSPQTGEIRISHRLRTVPGWVLDATIVHELAHLLHADHSTAFHAVANRYPRQHDAHVFLEGYSLGLHAAS
ncbi:MAG: M48 family metallopeptidase [Acidimicrobiales bacterium]